MWETQILLLITTGSSAHSKILKNKNIQIKMFFICMNFYAYGIVNYDFHHIIKKVQKEAVSEKIKYKQQEWYNTVLFE